MNIFRRFMAILLVLTLLIPSAFALTGEEAADRFRRAAAVINDRGLIAEREPITRKEIAASMALLEQEPNRLYEELNRYLSRMDTHSMYFAKTGYNDAYSSLVGYASIGVTLRVVADGEAMITEIQAGSPAAEAGLHVGDVLTAADGKQFKGLDVEHAGVLLRGEEGTTVELTVLSEGKTRTVRVTRVIMHKPELKAVELSAGVAYVAIEGFTNQETVTDFLTAWQEIEKRDTKGVVLDLRGNGGGVVDYALAVLDAITEEKKTLVLFEQREDMGGTRSFVSSGNGWCPEELVVLMNGRTASAAELTAGVLQESCGAVLLGEQSYGKGQGQNHLQISGDYLVLTVLEMILPEGGKWEGKGLTPDLKVKNGESAAERLNALPALDSETAIAYGSSGAKVRALTGRLMMLGYLSSERENFDTIVQSALCRFEEDTGLSQTVGAYPASLRLIDRLCRQAAADGRVADNQLCAAMTLCEAAARGTK